MRAKCSLLISCLLLLLLPIVAAADSVDFFPCVLDHSYALDGYGDYKEIDLRERYRASAGSHQDDDLMLESGSAIVLDQSILILDLHFSDSFDYQANSTAVPEQLTFFFNPAPNEMQVTVFPDRDDPYAFHYFGSFNSTMTQIDICGSYTDSEGELRDCFSLRNLILPITSGVESAYFFPCVLDHSYALDGYGECNEIDLRDWHRAAIDNWELDDLAVESGSAIVLDRSVLIIDLHLSDSFDFEANYTEFPERITLYSHESEVFTEEMLPVWRVEIFPDEDDPYAFHYCGTFNWTMTEIYMYGNDGESLGGFSLHIAVY